MHRPAPIPSLFDSLIPSDLSTPSFTSPSLNHQLRTPSPTAFNHLHPWSTSMANPNTRSPRSSTPSSTDYTNASYSLRFPSLCIHSCRRLDHIFFISDVHFPSLCLSLIHKSIPFFPILLKNHKNYKSKSISDLRSNYISNLFLSYIYSKPPCFHSYSLPPSVTFT